MNKGRTLVLVAGLMGLHLIFLLISRFTAWPEMLTWPYFMLKGLLPYRDIAIAHTPLLLLDLGLHFKIVGASIFSLKVFTWILILILDLLLYFSVSKIWDKKKALIALAFYIPLQVFYGGNGLWFDLYMSLFALWSFALVKREKFFWAGVVWALAFLSKQTAVWFLIPLAFEIFQKPKHRVKKFITGGIVVAGIFSIGLLSLNIWDDFVRWAISFGVLILPKAIGQIQLPTLRQLGVDLLPFLVLIPVFLKGKKERSLLLWILAGMAGVYPRWELFHFQPALPFLAMAWMIFIYSFKNYSKVLKLGFSVYILVCAVLLGKYLYKQLGSETRFYEKEVQEVSLYVDSITEKDEEIFVLNYWDSLYALTETLPATEPWVPQLEWYINTPGVEDDMLSDLSNNPPKYIIAMPYADSGLASYKPEKIVEFINNNYQEFQVVSGVNILRLREEK